MPLRPDFSPVALRPVLRRRHADLRHSPVAIRPVLMLRHAALRHSPAALRPVLRLVPAEDPDEILLFRNRRMEQ